MQEHLAEFTSPNLFKSLLERWKGVKQKGSNLLFMEYNISLVLHVSHEHQNQPLQANLLLTGNAQKEHKSKTEHDWSKIFI